MLAKLKKNKTLSEELHSVVSLGDVIPVNRALQSKAGLKNYNDLKYFSVRKWL